MSNSIFGDPIELLESERLSSEETNLSFSESESKVYEAMQAEASQVEQTRIVRKIIEDNVGADKMEGAGLTSERIAEYVYGQEFLQQRTMPKSMNAMGAMGPMSGQATFGERALREARTEETRKKLEKAGIDAQELYGRYTDTLKTRREQETRAGLLATIVGTVRGYADDRYNLATMFAAPGGAIKSGASIGSQVLKTAIANMAMEAAVTARLDTPLDTKAANVVGAGLGVAAMMGAGIGLKAASKKAMSIFNGSKLSKNVASKLSKVAEETTDTNLKAALKEEIVFLDRIGGTFDDAMEIRVGISKDIAEGRRVRAVKEKFKVELPGERVVGNTREELMENLRVRLEETPGLDRVDIEDALARMDEQEFIGNVDRYTVLSEDIPRTKRNFTRSSGRVQQLDETKKQLIYETRELAEAAVKKRKLEDVQVIAQRNGKYAVVRESDEPLQMAGTRRFATRADAEKELPEYAARFGVDAEDLSITTVGTKSKNPDIKVDHIITHNGSAARFAAPERATNTVLDTLSITKFKELSEASEIPSVDFAKEGQAKVVFEADKILNRTVETEAKISKDIDRYVDQLVKDDTIVYDIPDADIDLKKFNGFLKQARKDLSDFKNSCM